MSRKMVSHQLICSENVRMKPARRDIDETNQTSNHTVLWGKMIPLLL